MYICQYLTFKTYTMNIFKKWYIRRLTEKVTIAYLSNPNTNPVHSYVEESEQLRDIDSYVVNILTLGSNRGQKFFNRLMFPDEKD